MLLQLTFFLASLATLAVVHIGATKFFLYWKYLWLDIPVHVLGGICVALGVSVLPFFHLYLFERFRSPIVYALIAFSVGVLWEVFEFFSGITLMDDTFIPDTTLDLLMDIFGGLLGYSIVRVLKKL